MRVQFFYEGLEKMMKVPSSLNETIKDVEYSLRKRPVLQSMFGKCFLNTLETTVEYCKDRTIFVITGDIPAMWLRDSAAQVRQYLPLAQKDVEVQRIIESLIKKQFKYILLDPYANAFNKEANNHGHNEDITKRNSWVWERKYEIDSLCYPVQIAYLYWKSAKKDILFDQKFKIAIKNIINLWRTEQRHFELSKYRFSNPKREWSDTLHNRGMGSPANYTGMTWSGFRPSDDACVFGYLLPSNMFAVVVLKYIEEIANEVYEDTNLAKEAYELKQEIDNGIKTYGIVDHYKYGKIYSYETDGYGNHMLMDDSNVPSLLSIPYIGYTGTDDPIYKNTRKFLLSNDNPYYFEGKYAKGIGSPHTPKGYIWHISLAIQALTSNNIDEINEILHTFENTHADTRLIHESFNADEPNSYTRPWFAWGNSLFSELIYKLVRETDIFK